MNVELKAIQLNEPEEVYQMLQEIPAEEDGFENPAHGLTREEFKVFCQTEVDYAKGVNLQQGHVPATSYIMYVNNQPVGLVKFRHFLNDFLRRGGGHIGYGIRPSARGNKWGNRILQEVLKFVKAKGVDKALLTIRDYNTRSRRVCEYNGGVLEKIEPREKFGECFYWIEIK